MIRLIGYFIAFAAFVTAIVWLNNNPGFVEFSWFGYHIKSSIGLFIAAGVMIVILAIITWRLVRAILGAPDAFGIFFSSRRRRKGFDALSKGIIAVGSGDIKAAHKFSRIADDKLDDEPLTLLLKAQAAQLEGNADAAHAAFEKMSKQSATKMLGLRGLFVEAERQGNGANAKLIALDAVAHNGQSKWAINGLFDLQTAEGDWAGALNTLLMKGRLSGSDAIKIKRQRAVLLTGEAMHIEADHAERALELTLEARNLAPELVPATLLAAKLLLAKGSVRKAHKLLEKCWRLAPHPELGALFAQAKDGETDKVILKRVQNFAAKAGVGNSAVKAQATIEAAVLVARVAIDYKDWNVAREALENIVADGPSARVCTLMAKIEQGELGNKGLVAEWLARAQHAGGDPIWLADGHIAAQWAPISPISGALDAYEWKMPDYHLAKVEADLAANILLEHHEIEQIAIEVQEKTLVESKALEIVANEAKANEAKAIKDKNLEQEKTVQLEKNKLEQEKAEETRLEIAKLVKDDDEGTGGNGSNDGKTDKSVKSDNNTALQPADDSPQNSGAQVSQGLLKNAKNKIVDGSHSPYRSSPVTNVDVKEQVGLVRRPDDPGLLSEDEGVNFEAKEHIGYYTDPK